MCGAFLLFGWVEVWKHGVCLAFVSCSFVVVMHLVSLVLVPSRFSPASVVRHKFLKSYENKHVLFYKPFQNIESL